MNELTLAQKEAVSDAAYERYASQLKKIDPKAYKAFRARERKLGIVAKKKKTRKKARRKASGRRKKTKKSGNSFKVCFTRAQLKRLGVI